MILEVSILAELLLQQLSVKWGPELREISSDNGLLLGLGIRVDYQILLDPGGQASTHDSQTLRLHRFGASDSGTVESRSY